jgi:predicted CXXCH cytochrome family protein
MPQHVEIPKRRPRAALAVLALLCWSGPVLAGVYAETGHGNPAAGVLRDPSLPRGGCGQCHVEGDAPVRYAKELFRENDNELCFACHTNENITGVYPGRLVYETSNHRTDARTVWPGPIPPARREAGAGGKCLNCHGPHGKQDASGLVPSQLLAREEGVCLACHDGDPSARDIAREIRKPYSHPAVQTTGKHRTDEGGDPSRFSYVGGNRHAECADCHNAHASFGDPVPPAAPAASARNARTSRIRVVNGAAGTIPLYEYRPANDTSTPVLEYEICFKCHSSWTNQPPGEQDLALLFNTNNASYHPVEAQGKSPGIPAGAFAGGKNGFSVIHCGDCHGSDDSTLKGPHGSQFPNILRKAYESRSISRITTREELCFLCHNFDTYANPVVVPGQPDLSRFNPPAYANGHTSHVGQRNVPCYACHDSHGSPQFPALISTGRTPGILSFIASGTGGTCTPTCHGTQTYVLNYPR